MAEFIADHYTKQKLWGDMLAGWEAQKDKHHELCPNRQGWDSSCQCKFIHKITEYVLEEYRLKTGELL